MVRKTKKFKQARALSRTQTHVSTAQKTVATQRNQSRTNLYEMTELDRTNRTVTQRDTIKALLLLGVLLLIQYFVYLRIDDLKSMFQ